MKSQNVQVGAPGKQDYETPDEFFRIVDEQFKFSFDLAASPSNAKCAQYIAQEYGHDSLKEPWWTIHGWLWLNPPFADIRPWAEKCLRESERGARVVMLTLASTGANWFRDFCWRKCEIRFLNGRLKFKGAKDPFPKDLALYIFESGRHPVINIWDWRTK